jgi:hypothetical protein
VPRAMYPQLVILCFGWLWMAIQGAGQDASAVRRLAPHDVSRTNAALREVRDRVMSAAVAERIEQLAPWLADHIYAEPDGGPRAAFIETFRRQPAETRALFWQELRDALGLGLTYGRGGTEACAPYTFRRIPEGDREDQVLMAVTGSGVALREQPRADSPVLERLTYDLVELLSADPADQPAAEGSGRYHWFKVKAPSGRSGWVHSRHVRGNFSARFCFTQDGASWRFYAYGLIGE